MINVMSIPMFHITRNAKNTVALPDDTMTNLVNKIEREGKVLFDFSKVEKEHKELEEQITIYDYSEISSLDNGSQIGTYDHPKFFDYALKYSKKEI